MSRWFSYLTYDIMGQLTFSQSYDMLTKDDHHFIQPLIDSYQHSQVIVRMDMSALLLHTDVH